MSRQDIDCALIAALMWGPKTRAQLSEEVSSLRTIDKVLAKLHHHGLIYRAGSIRSETNAEGNRRDGKWPVLWAFNSTPFAEADRVTRHGTPICQTNPNPGARSAAPRSRAGSLSSPSAHT